MDGGEGSDKWRGMERVSRYGGRSGELYGGWRDVRGVVKGRSSVWRQGRGGRSEGRGSEKK